LIEGSVKWSTNYRNGFALFLLSDRISIAFWGVNCLFFRHIYYASITIATESASEAMIQIDSELDWSTGKTYLLISSSA